MAHECPDKKRQFTQSGPTPFQFNPRPSGPTPQFKPKFSGPPKRPQGFQKFNKTRKPVSRIRTASIEEVQEEEEEEYDQEEDEVPSLAIRTARLSPDQREQWLKEMNNMGINF